MSRNFELLQHVQHELGAAATEHWSAIEATSAPTPAQTPSATGFEVPADVVCLEEKDPALLTEIKKMAQQVFLLEGQAAPRVVMFAGVETQEEPDMICARTAAMLTRLANKTVCAIDADFSQPSLHEFFHISNHMGFSDALSTGGPIQQFAHVTPDALLTVVPSGPVVADCQKLLAADTTRARLLELRQQFDFVMIAAPPLNCFSETMSLARFADGVLVTLEAHSTRREAAVTTTEQLRRAQVRVLGAVLNNLRSPNPPSIYANL